jgi:hypothetical protein
MWIYTSTPPYISTGTTLTLIINSRKMVQAFVLQSGHVLTMITARLFDCALRCN